jgi:signal transduction histidine kinase/ActR/RegA family two-component response regulator
MKNIKFEFRITLIYLIVGILWIIFSDRILEYIISDINPNSLGTFQSIKGAFFIIITSLLLYILVKKHLQKLKFTEQELQQQNSNYEALNTEYKAQNLELLAAKEKAEESDRLKTAFLHNISHEIRTPMNAIVGYSDLLNEPDLPPENIKDFTTIIEQSSNQLLSVITDLISISTIEAGQQKINEKAININDLGQHLLNQFILKARSQNINLNFKSALIGEKAEIISDETKLIEILSNLIVNALKFTIQGSVTFGYNIKGDFIEFYVSDTGIGIAEEFHEDIFKRFRRVENSLSRQHSGTGLGLSISKAYVELLGGRIWLTSEIVKGTTFYFTIPLKIPKSARLLPDISNIENPIDNEKKLTLLVVEDETLNFRLLEQYFTGLNCKILHALNGLEATEMCKSVNDIDLVLMDLKMPVMDGFEATKIIKEIRPELTVIAQTAYTNESDKEKALAYGCSDFISKPFSKASFLSIMKKHLPKE